MCFVQTADTTYGASTIVAVTAHTVMYIFALRDLSQLVPRRLPHLNMSLLGI